MDTTQSSPAGIRAGAIALLAFYIDMRVFAYYIIMYIMVALMFPQPTYKGPSRIEDFTPASFAELVEDRSESNVSWLVEFFAPWAPQCLYLEPVIAELSLQYSSPTLRFGKIDVSRWPALAKRFKISVRGENGNQLPTLIMFETGKEKGRIPHVYNDGKVAAGKYRKNDIVTAFALGEKQNGKGAVHGTLSKKKGGNAMRTGSGGKKKN